MSHDIFVEVAYAGAERQEILALTVPHGTTAAEAVARSRIAEHFPEIDLAKNKIGIFGKLTKPETLLRDRDRVEIYRSLVADPKEGRRQRAQQRKAITKAGKGK